LNGTILRRTVSSRLGIVVYKMGTSRHETVLYNFCAQPGCTDRVAACAGVLRDSAGNVDGTTYYGGVSGYGTVYKLDSAGTQTVLYNVMGGAGWARPYAGVTRDHKGNLYGTTTFGGENPFGVVFKLEPE
jgi:uncharacterized repeat protein (TIGR03803 family)